MADSVQVRGGRPTDWSNIRRANIVGKFDTTFDVLPAAQRIVAGEKYVYVYGFDTSGGTNKLRQFDKLLNAFTINTYDLAVAATDCFGMVYDGRYVYMGIEFGGNYFVYQVDGESMADGPIGTVQLSGRLNRLVYDGKYFYGINSSTGHIYRVTKGATELEQITVTPFSGPFGSMTMTKDCVYLNQNGGNLGVLVKKSKNHGICSFLK